MNFYFLFCRFYCLLSIFRSGYYYFFNVPVQLQSCFNSFVVLFSRSALKQAVSITYPTPKRFYFVVTNVFSPLL